MSISGVSSNGSAYQPAPIAQHHHKKAEPAQSDSSSQTPAAASVGKAAADYHGVSGASGRIDIKA